MKTGYYTRILSWLNILFFSLLLLFPKEAFAQTTATLSVSPTNSTITNVGDTATPTFQVTAAERLGHFEFYVHYDPLVVQVASTSDVAEGSFLSSTGRTVTLLPPEIDNVAGNVKVGASSFGAADGPSGSGTLLSITFTAQGSGTSSIDIQNVLLVNSDPVPVVQPSTEVNGTITVGTPPTCACTLDLPPTPISLYVGQSVDLTASHTDNPPGCIAQVDFSSSNAISVPINPTSDATPPYTTTATCQATGSTSINSKYILTDNTIVCQDAVSVTCSDAPPAGAIIDDFEGYGGSNANLNSVYTLNVEGNTGTLSLFTQPPGYPSGQYGAQLDYTVGAPNYAGFWRDIANANWTGNQGLQFWFNPDGTGRSLIIQFMESGGEFWEAYPQFGGSMPHIKQLAFTDFVHPYWYDGTGGNGVIDLDSIGGFAFYVDRSAGNSGSGTVYFDDFVLATTITPTCAPVRGDINGDCCVNLQDYSILFAYFGQPPPPEYPEADIVIDDIINILDYSLLFTNWGRGTCLP